MSYIKKIIIIVIILFLAIICSQMYFSFAVDDVYVTISGVAKDADGNLLKEITVHLLNSDGSEVGNSVKTNENGKYEFKAPKGTYKVKFEYQANYENPKITFKTYSVYTKKVELAYLYDTAYSSSKMELENLIKERLTNKENRTIIREHSNIDELKTHMNELELNIINPYAFHEIKFVGCTGILIINSNVNITKDEINAIKNSPYKYEIINTNNMNDVIDKIMELLNETSGESNELDITNKNSIQTTSVESNKIDIQTSSIINLCLEKSEDEIINQIETDSNAILVKGNIYADNAILKETPVRVSLIDVNTKKMNSYIVYDGQYYFEYPVSGGDFVIQFEINCGKYHGQNYELTPQDRKISERGGNLEQNVGAISNIENIKEIFKNITTEQEQQILQTENAKKPSKANENTKLIVQTDSFTIQPSSSLYDIFGNFLGFDPFLGSIKIQEREKFQLSVEKYVQNLKLTLTNGSILIDYNSDSNDNGEYIATTNDKAQHVITLDPELKHGATLQVVYAIKIKNNGNIDCTSFTLIDYLSYDNLGFVYDNDAVISGDIRNSTYWEQKKSTDIKDYLKNGNELEDDARFNNAIYLQYVENEGLKAKEEKTIYLTTSRVLTNTTDDDSSLQNEVELIQYSNNDGRRNYNINNTAIQAGNYCIATEKNQEADSDKVSIEILPPYGENKNVNKYIYIFMLLIFIIILIKLNKGGKYYEKRKN